MQHSFPVALFMTSIFTMTVSMAQSLTYPDTRKTTQVDTYHGVTVADPYRWLEDDNSDETKAWVREQNAVTDKFLAAIPQREAIRKLYTELYNYEKFGIPFREGGHYFWTHNSGLQQQSVVYFAKTLNDAPQVALDPNTMSKDGTVALTRMVPSRDGKYMAYGVASSGSDWQEWKVRNLASGKDLADTIKWVKFSTVSWTPDGKGFFYSRYDEPKVGEALTGSNFFHKIYYHRLGEAQTKDVLVLESKDKKEWGFQASVTDDGKYVLIVVRQGSGRKNGLMWMPLQKGGGAPSKPLTLTLDFDAEYTPIGSNGSTVWIKTDKDAPKGRIVSVDLVKPDRANWKTIIAERKETLISATATGGQIFAQYLKDAATQIRAHAPDGKLIREVSLPGIGTATGFTGRWRHDETYFSYTSLTTPAEIYRYDIKSGKATLFKRPKTAFNPDEFETHLEFVTSKDGTKFPLFLAYRKGLKRDGTNPTLLYGYGGFNVSMTPTYRGAAAAWLRMGGVYALACLRGGGEYGGEWHDAGTKLKKQNVFDDFIAAAEWLSANKYTQPAKLAINGGSNGGLLVGAVLNQRPELFGAAVPEVGVMDMLRYHKFTIGWAWASDYGIADKADEFNALYAYSPLHTIPQGKKFPPVLVMTADHDDRVVPAHSFKYMATLQAADTGAAQKLIRIETRAGHGAGSPTSKIIDGRTDMLAFIAQAIDMQVK